MVWRTGLFSGGIGIYPEKTHKYYERLYTSIPAVHDNGETRGWQASLGGHRLGGSCSK